MAEDIVLDSNATTLVLNGFTATDLMAGDNFVMTPVNDATSRQRGSNGVTIQGRVDANDYILTINSRKAGTFDVWLNEQKNKRPIVVFKGSMKTIMYRDGVEFIESYDIQSGSFGPQPIGTVNDQDGNISSVYGIPCIAKRNM